MGKNILGKSSRASSAFASRLNPLSAGNEAISQFMRGLLRRSLAKESVSKEHLAQMQTSLLKEVCRENQAP
jgi:hypothetical protein